VVDPSTVETLVSAVPNRCVLAMMVPGPTQAALMPMKLSWMLLWWMCGARLHSRSQRGESRRRPGRVPLDAVLDIVIVDLVVAVRELDPVVDTGRVGSRRTADEIVVVRP